MSLFCEQADPILPLKACRIAQRLLNGSTSAAVIAVALGCVPMARRAFADVPGAVRNHGFDLNEIRVEGSTLLPADAVEEVVYPFLGPNRQASDVEAARRALEDAYQKAGYATVSVSVPRQNVAASEGVIRMDVTERVVGRLRVKGSRYFVPDAVRAGAPSLAPGKVPHMPDVTRDLVGLNQLPDRTVEPQLRPGRVPGTVDVDLNVTDTFPLHGSVELNNRYNADTHALRLNSSLSYNNFFQRGDSGTIAYSVAPEDVQDAEITSASYLFHIPASRLSLLVSYLHSNSNVTALGTTNVAGRGTTAGFRLLVPLGATGSFSHSFSVGWDYKKYYELDTFTTTNQLTSAPITYYPLSATYAANWSGRRSTTDATVGVVLGLGSIGSNTAEFENKRLYAPRNFAVLKAGVSREEDLDHDIQLWGNVQGQLSNEPLVSSEQFGLGGADSVRGYLESETLGDYGTYVQTELRSPSIARYIRGPLHSWRFHLFADAGYVGLQRAQLGQLSGQGLTSAGIGTRLNLWGYFNAALQDAQTFNHGPNTHSGTNRVLFRLYGEF